MAVEWDYDHIGIVVRDLDAAVKHYSRMSLELLKPPEVGSIETASTRIQFKECFIQNQAIRIKLIQPIEDGNPYSDYLRVFNISNSVLKTCKRKKLGLPI